MSNVGGVNSSRVGAFETSEAATVATAAATSAPITLTSGALKNQPSLAGVAAGTAEIGFGARGDGAKAIQNALIQAGVLRPPADGAYGRGTQTAVATFQRQAGLDPTGNVDQKTLAKLDEKIRGGATPPSTPAYTGPVDRSLVFIGLGDGAVDEAKNFANRTATTSITDSKVNDVVNLKIAGQTKTYDLTKKEGCDAYVRDIGLTGAKAAEVSQIILDAGDDARDETAGVAKVFAEAQGGKRNMERLAISGHSYGEGVWGDHNGYFELGTLSKLATAFPAAARQVQDFGYHGCYSGGEGNMDKFKAIFPNMKTAWAYTGSAPGTYSGALAHMNRWENATRGDDASKVQMGLAAGTRKGENVSTWNAVSGYQSSAPPRPLSELRADFESGRAGFAPFLSGASVVANTQEGPVRSHYNAIQHLLQSAQLPSTERPALEALRDQTIRLNFYDSMVKGKFQGAHAAKITAGFGAVGLPAPDFSTLSRKDALAQVAAFEAKLKSMSPKPAAAQTLLPLLTDGIRDLKASQIPSTWI